MRVKHNFALDLHDMVSMVLNMNFRISSAVLISVWSLLLTLSVSQDQDISGSGASQNGSCVQFSSRECSELPLRCLECDFNSSCVYGSSTTVSCKPLEGLECEVDLATCVISLCMYIDVVICAPPVIALLSLSPF